MAACGRQFFLFLCLQLLSRARYLRGFLNGLTPLPFESNAGLSVLPSGLSVWMVFKDCMRQVRDIVITVGHSIANAWGGTFMARNQQRMTEPN